MTRVLVSGRPTTPHARCHEHQACTGLAQLREELARVEQAGGEGLMLRMPGSRYEVGRSSTLLKVKSFRDAEARVVGHQPGAGRHAGRLGALLVEMADGTRFSVGTGFSDAERKAPPPIGAIINVPLPGAVEGWRAALPVVRGPAGRRDLGGIDHFPSVSYGSELHS